MARQLVQLFVVSSLIFVIGAHWAILQSVAWTGMVISYSQDAPLKEALQKTFDGDHPCGLCKLVDEGKKSEREQEQQKTETKLDFFCVNELIAVELPLPFSLPTSRLGSLPDRGETPPVPPPRHA